MKLAIIGGAGVRTPLLVQGLAHSDLPIDSIALYDVERERLRVIAALAGQLADGVRVEPTDDVRQCVEGAAFVFTSIRVGGIEARAQDEATALRHGIVGQETIGPAGFAMAVRTIPPIVEYARAVERYAPTAWMINFTNPVGIVTQAMRTATGARVIGICDTPTELFEEIAHALGVPSSECYFDYFGLNHLGWVREVFHRGEPQLHRLWADPSRLAAIYRAPLFTAEFLRDLKLLPTEYLYYYYRAGDAFTNVSRAGRSRGAVIRDLNNAFFAALAEPGADAPTLYTRYLQDRNAGYMQIESGATSARMAPPWNELTGYDKIALSVVRAIHFNTGSIIPLNVPNRGNLPELQDDDIVEVPCVVNGNGARPLHVGAAPAQVRDLLVGVKEYERQTVAAALTGDRVAAQRALAYNPLVGNPDLATTLVEQMA
jgi:6-phospho-beta-glucosidase